jgi:nucleotide-binding universal stress UspA family protein
MAIKNILVAFNGSESSENALLAAQRMQQKYGAHVTGLLAHEGKREKFAGRPWVPDNVRGIIEAAVQSDEERLEARFRDVFKQAPKEQVHWISLAAKPDSAVAQYACMYDITLVGREVRGQVEATNLHPERIALKSGRPVLVVPPGELAAGSMDKPAVLAWDGARAATRALNDAMLILETKQRVDIVSIGPKIRPPLDGIDVVTALQRHGVNARRIRRKTAARSIGEDILAYCDEVDAGLLVMGAFEHSIFRQELLGGTTMTVLAKSKMPVLISH